MSASYVAPAGKRGPSFTKVDVTREVELAQTYNVHSYPTLYYFPGVVSGSSSSPAPVKYGGYNSEEDLKKFLDRQLYGFEVTKIDSSQQFDDFVGNMNKEVVVIYKGSASGKGGKALQAIYKDVISDELLRRKTLYFGKITKDATFGPECESDCLEVWNKVTGVKRTLSENLTEENMTKFIVAVGSVMDPYVPALLSKSQSNSITKQFLMVISTPVGVGILKGKVVEELLGNHMGTVGAVWVDPEETPVILEHYNLNVDDNNPVVLLMDISGGVGTIVTKLLSGAETEGVKLVDNIRNCWNDYIPASGECGAVIRTRSEPAKKGNMKMKPAKQLVGKNLKRNIVLADEKDQFIYFYSQGDKEYARNDEEFGAFAGRYTMEPTIDFFRFNVDDNDITLKQIEVATTPVVWFFPGNNKNKPVRFEAEEFLNEHMFDFLRKQVTVPFKGYVSGRKYVGWAGRIKFSLRMMKKKGFLTWLKVLFGGKAGGDGGNMITQGGGERAEEL